MGYMHIDNLYKNQRILLFRECYALEKIHGNYEPPCEEWRKGREEDLELEKEKETGVV